MKTSGAIDRHGSRVAVGDKVRLYAIRPSILRGIQGETAAIDVGSMIDQIVEVFDVYDDGQVWVSANFPRVDGLTEIHAIAVDPEAIELVTE